MKFKLVVFIFVQLVFTNEVLADDMYSGGSVIDSNNGLENIFFIFFIFSHIFSVLLLYFFITFSVFLNNLCTLFNIELENIYDKYSFNMSCMMGYMLILESNMGTKNYYNLEVDNEDDELPEHWENKISSDELPEHNKDII